MKKQYINPTIQIVKIEGRRMLSGSLDMVNNTGTVSESSVSEGTAGESRGFFGFGDEE